MKTICLTSVKNNYRLWWFTFQLDAIYINISVIMALFTSPIKCKQKNAGEIFCFSTVNNIQMQTFLIMFSILSTTCSEKIICFKSQRHKLPQHSSVNLCGIKAFLFYLYIMANRSHFSSMLLRYLGKSMLSNFVLKI